jgi:polyisoprenoid-binding protein YceI
MHTRTASCAAAILLGLAWPGASSPARAAETYKVDPLHSSLLFRVKHLNVGHIYGRFTEFSGSFTFDDKDPAACSLSMEVNVDSLDSAVAKRDQHLKGPDFFNVKQFPTMSFKSSKMKAVDARTYEVTGDLTLHGVTRPVTVQLERIGTGKGMGGETRTGFETTFTIKRSDFGMKYMIPAIGDEVKVIVAVEGIQ